MASSCNEVDSSHESPLASILTKNIADSEVLSLSGSLSSCKEDDSSHESQRRQGNH